MDCKDKEPVRSSVMQLRARLAVLACVPDLLLVVALGLAWYVRWHVYDHRPLLYVLVVGSSLLISNLLLRHYYNVRFVSCAYRWWIGCLLGLVALLDVNATVAGDLHELELLANVLLSASALCHCLCQLTARLCVNTNTHSGKADFCELLGVACACVLGGHEHSAALMCVLIAFACVLLALRMGSMLSIINLAFLIFVTDRFILSDLNVSVDPWALLCLLRLTFAPICDILLGGVCRLDKWASVIMSGGCTREVLLLLMLFTQGAFFYSHAYMIRFHKEWYVIVPMFAAVSVVWMLLHFVLLLNAFTLNRKFYRSSDGVLSDRVDVLGLSRVLAARGVRYFSLVAQRVAYAALGSSVVLGLMCWTVRTPYNHSLLVIVTSVELMLAELLYELSSTLGGTCIAYACVAPVLAQRNDGMVTVVPVSAVQSCAQRATTSLQCIVDLFTQHMLTQFGADYSMTGLNRNDTLRKLNEFFSQCTHEGPRYDTYLLYYSAPTTATGDWAMTGNEQLSLDNLLSTWSECNNGVSRLILVCDTEHSHNWLRSVWRDKVHAVCLQTSKCNRTKDSESVAACVGSLTQYWTAYNRTGGHVASDLQPRNYKALYAVSSAWMSHSLRVVGSAEMREYWLKTVPSCSHRALQPVLCLLSARLPVSVSGCVQLVTGACRRCRLRVWPPAIFDTGHALKLITQ